MRGFGPVEYWGHVGRRGRAAVTGRAAKVLEVQHFLLGSPIAASLVACARPDGVRVATPEDRLADLDQMWWSARTRGALARRRADLLLRACKEQGARRSSWDIHTESHRAQGEGRVRIHRVVGRDDRDRRELPVDRVALREVRLAGVHRRRLRREYRRNGDQREQKRDGQGDATSQGDRQDGASLLPRPSHGNGQADGHARCRARI